MRFYVFYNYGSCMYQDHSVGLDEFSTKEAALRRCTEILKENPEAWVDVIQGEAVSFQSLRVT